MKARRRRIPLPVAAVLAILGVAAGVVWAQSNSAPSAKREALAAFKNPIGAKGRTLALSRVTIPPGVTLPLHFHQGTQVAYIQSGVLSYSVHDGKVTVMKGAADEQPTVVRKIKAGQTGKIKAGQWIVEQPSVHHSASNNGNQKIVVLLSTLLKNGAPPATPVSQRHR
jgi:quercetin dioxygenase-like cupin family protein